MQTLKQTRFLTKNYSNLQGLRTLPMGLCLLLVSLWANAQHGPARDLSLPLLMAGACLLLFLAIDRYYKRVFGRVKSLLSRADLLLWGAAGILALAAFLVDSNTALNLPFSTLGLVFAADLLVSGLLFWGRAKLPLVGNLLLAVVIAILSILPVLGFSGWWTVLGIKHSVLALTSLFGVYVIIGGVIGHIYFIRALPKTAESQHG